MHLFSWLDIRTLVASQCPAAAIFALVLLGMRRIYPHLRGADLFAAGFLLWIPATIFAVAQGAVPVFVSSIGGNLLLIGCYIMLYRGVLSFFQRKGALPLLYDVAAVAAAVIIYFTVVSDGLAPRGVAMACISGIARGFMAYEFYRSSSGSRFNLLFAACLAIFAIFPFSIATVALFYRGSSTLPVPHNIETISVLSNAVFLSVFGLFLLWMYFSEISEAVQQKGQLDFLTGTLNRRAIEETLTVEIARSSRTSNPVSAMLIEVDHFKLIHDIHGSAKADEALCTVVRTIASILRFYDKCGRLADDRFLVLLPENAAEHAMVIASRFREALKQPTLPHDQPAITLSIGVTQCVLKESSSEVLDRAEIALAEARRQGGDRACLNFKTLQEISPGNAGQLDRLTSGTHSIRVIR